MENFIEFIGYDAAAGTVITTEDDVGTVTYTNNVPVSHTGDTDEFTFKSLTIPGGLLLANSVIEIDALFSQSGDGDKDMTVLFGDTVYCSALASGFNVFFRQAIFCNNSLTAQKGPPTVVNDNGAFIDPITTSDEDTTEDVVISFKGRTNNPLGTVQFEGYRVKVNGV